MKTKILLLVVVIVLGIITPSFIQRSSTQFTIKVQAFQKDITPTKLQEASTIMTERLKDFGCENFIVNVNEKSQQIQFSFEKKPDTLCTKLLTKPGVFGFYEIRDQKGLSETMKSKQPEFLKVTGEKNRVLGSNDMESIKTFKDSENNRIEIRIRFNKSAVGIWAEATKRNLDKSIAIVLDDEILAAPVVRSVIEGGNCSITGDFSWDEARVMTAMGSHKTLPCSFDVVK